MIRFIRIGEQIMEGDDAFAFWDTISDHFVDVDGEFVFTSIFQLNSYLETSGYDQRTKERLLGFAKGAIPPVREMTDEDREEKESR